METELFSDLCKHEILHCATLQRAERRAKSREQGARSEEQGVRSKS